MSALQPLLADPRAADTSSSHTFYSLGSDSSSSSSSSKPSLSRRPASSFEDARRGVLATKPSGVRVAQTTAADKEMVEKVDNHGILFPWMPAYKVWWSVTAVAAIFTVFFGPLQIAFQGEPGTFNNMSNPVECFLTLIFAVDILVNFNLAFDKDEVVVFERAAIVKEYLRLMFWVDLVGVFPFETVALLLVRELGGTPSNKALLFSLLRLFRLVRLHRMKKLNDLLLQHHPQVPLLLFALVRHLRAVLTVTHLAACSVSFVARLESFDDTPWLGPRLLDASGFDRYVTALYCTIVQVITVGCGDYVPISTAEKICATFFMMVNLVVAAWIIGSITLLVVNGDERTGEYRDGLETLDDFSLLNQVDEPFQEKFKAQLRLGFKNQASCRNSVYGRSKAETRRRKKMLFHRFLLLFSLSVPLLALSTIAPTTNALSDDKDGGYELENDNEINLDEILFSPQPCPTECTDPKLLNQRQQSGGARIFYLLLIHNERTQNDAVHLFRAIRDPRNIVVAHYDTDAQDLLLHDDDDNNNNRLRHEMETCPCGSTVRLESVHTVEWSQWSMNLPTLWGLQVAIDDYNSQWDTFVNLSGDTMAVYTANAMAELLHELGHYNFVTSRSCETDLLPTPVYHFPAFWHKRRHYTRDETEEPPVLEYVDEQGQAQNKTVTIHFGSQWVVLQHDFCAWLVQQLNDDNPQHSSWPSQLRDYLQTSGFLMTDETFLPTVLMHADEFAETLPVYPLHFRSNGTTISTLHHVRYERMDEHYPTAFGVFPEHQHYQVPDRLLPIIAQPRVWGPYFLGVYDLGGIRAAGALFCRKVSAYLDDNLVRLLPVDDWNDIPDVRWHPVHEISLTARPDWSAERAQWKELVERKSSPQDEEDNDDEEL